MKLATIFVLAASLAAAAAAPPQGAVLPAAFAGWQVSGSPQVSTDPASADPALADLLKEYGFNRFESATFVKPDRKITIKAIRFNDAGGAYGAFTYYKTPEMQVEKIGDQGASNNERVLFYRGNVLVEATLDRTTAMSAAELRELADGLPRPAGNAANLPVLPTYLPHQGYVPNTAKYVNGPIGLNGIGAPISPADVDFSTGAEVVLGQYSTSGGNGTLTLISYPTPQLAGQRMRAIESAHPQAGAQQTFQVKRTGPILAIVAGAISPSEAHSILGLVNYDADVTWNEPTFMNPKESVGGLLVGVILLTTVLLLLALVAGLAFGGLRILAKRLFPDRVFDKSQDVEIIQLNLRG